MPRVKTSRRVGYTMISVPNDLVERIESLINEGKIVGYRTRTEFIIDAIRRRLEELDR